MNKPPTPGIGDARTLRALAHPLRLRLLGLLRTLGPSTATRLAAACGESSALTSYHLRRLAEVGMILPADPGALTEVTVHARDRWWVAASALTSTAPPAPGDDAGREAGTQFAHAVVTAHAERARLWLDQQEHWAPEWAGAATLGDRQLRLTPAEARELGAEIAAVIERYRPQDPARAANPEDSVIIAAQYAVFPAPEVLPPANPA